MTAWPPAQSQTFYTLLLGENGKQDFSFATSSPTPTQSITTLNMVAIRNAVESGPCNS